jgi:lipopolysaccharide/colanic/teichoic acid biosynthesis glycosyltransferase
MTRAPQIQTRSSPCSQSVPVEQASPRFALPNEQAYDFPWMAAIQSNQGAKAYDRLKLLCESVAGTFLLLLCGPLIALCWVSVRLGSGGSGFYTQTRVGKSGRVFVIYKIRTMYQDAEQKHGGARWSKSGDSRVTPIGRLLRKLHLDELPQLVNVVLGQMSLVGPRPERPEFVIPLSREIRGYVDRLAVRPGVTGLAQIQLPADSDLQSVAKKLAADLKYIQQRSLWLDLRLLFGTGIYLVGLSYERVKKLAMLPICEDSEAQYDPTRVVEPVTWPAKSR